MTDIRSTLARLFSKLEVIQDTNLDMESKGHLADARKLCHELISQMGFSNDSKAAPATAQSAAPANQAAATNNSAEKENTHIMIVDDDEDTQRMLRFALKKKGFNVTSFTNPIEALNNLMSVNPDIILLDLMMPEMTGFEFLQRVSMAPNRSTFKIAVGSSRTYDKDRVTVLEAGANDFIAKPYNLAELVVRLHNLAA